MFTLIIIVITDFEGEEKWPNKSEYEEAMEKKKAYGLKRELLLIVGLDESALILGDLATK